MPLLTQWATPGDFATLFQYFWHRDFPIDQEHAGAKRADWTIHIGQVVRNMADLMGLYARFETRDSEKGVVLRMDAVLRNADGKDEVALEWEWEGVEGNELGKLKDYKPFGFDKGVYCRGGGAPLRYAVLVTYADTTNAEDAKLGDVYDYVKTKWKDALSPLLFVLIDWKKPDKSMNFWADREFKNIRTFVLDSGEWRSLQPEPVPALPWNVPGTRWCKPRRKDPESIPL